MEEIAYKVVDPKTRYGTNIILAKRNCDSYTLQKLLNAYPEYFPQYHKEVIVEKAPETEGLFVFPEKEHAENFVFAELHDLPVKIIRVQPLAELKQPKRVFAQFGARPWELPRMRNFRNLLVLRSTPAGSKVCNKLKVLE